MFSYLPLVLRNAVRNRRRTALTVASVAVSLCLLGVLLALYRSLFYGSDTTPGQAMRLVVHHKIALTQDLPVAYEEKIAQIPGVRAVTRLRWFGGTYKDARDTKNQFAQFVLAFCNSEFRIDVKEGLRFDGGARAVGKCNSDDPHLCGAPHGRTGILKWGERADDAHLDTRYVDSQPAAGYPNTEQHRRPDRRDSRSPHSRFRQRRPDGRR